MNTRVAPGERVGAVIEMNSAVIRLVGYGVFDGEHEPPFGPFGLDKDVHDRLVADMKARGELPQDYRWTNPRITLDDGTVVWGAWVWWAPEAKVRELANTRLVEHAKLPDHLLT